jgi:hypothetical protein
MATHRSTSSPRATPRSANRFWNSSSTCTDGAYDASLGVKSATTRWFITWKRTRSATQKSVNEVTIISSALRGALGSLFCRLSATARYSDHASPNIAS